MKCVSTVAVLAACVVVNGATGCAYVEYRRTYELSVLVPEAQRKPLSELLERFFVQRGLVLKQKYRDLYPRNVLVSTFEIPRTPEEDRRHPELLVTTTDTGLVQVIQSEYYFDIKPPPQDLIAEARPELLEAIAASIGDKPRLNLVDRARRAP